MTRVARVVIATLYALVGGGFVSAQPANWPPTVSFSDQTAYVATPNSGGTYTLHLSVKEYGQAQLSGTWSIFSKEPQCRGAPVVASSLVTLRLGELQHASVVVNGVEGGSECYIQLLVPNPNAKQPLVLAERVVRFQSGDFTLILGFVLALACALSVAVVVIGWRQLKREGARPDTVIGSPEWEISKSWSANMALLTAIISTVLARQFVPSMTAHASHAGYDIVILLLAILVLAGPFIFVLLRKNVVQQSGSVSSTGTLRAFLGCSTISAFAVTGQFGVFLLLLDEVRRLSAQGWVLWGLEASVTALAAAMVAYSFQMICVTGRLSLQAAKAPQAVGFAGDQAPPPKWTVF